MEIKDLYNIYRQSNSVTTDSRKCPENAIFFAIKGEKDNGNKFALDALKNGCGYAVVDANEWEEGTNSRVIEVDNVLTTLQELANYHRKQLKIPIIGIAGSNGKTTTKELITAVLAKGLRVAATQDNFNNELGVPLILLSINEWHEIGVIEMGAKNLKHIEELCKIVEPDFGLITNCGKDHLETYGTIENVIKGNCELYDFLRETNGKVFVNKDDSILFEKSEGMNRKLYGKKGKTLFVSGDIVNPKQLLLEFEWKFRGSPLPEKEGEYTENQYRIKTHLAGNYNLDNLLTAVTVGKFFGIHAEQINAALAEYKPKNNRSQFERTEHNDLIIDAYNANPTSMQRALNSFLEVAEINLPQSEVEHNKLPKAVILGEMKEGGDTSESEHRAILELVRDETSFEKAYLVGDVYKNLGIKNEKLFYFSNVEELCEELTNNPISGYFILLKGSNSVELPKLKVKL